MLFLEDFAFRGAEYEDFKRMDAYDGVKQLCLKYNEYYVLMHDTCSHSAETKKEFLKFIEQGSEKYLQDLIGLRKIFSDKNLLNNLQAKREETFKPIGKDKGFNKGRNTMAKKKLQATKPPENTNEKEPEGKVKNTEVDTIKTLQ